VVPVFLALTEPPEGGTPNSGPPERRTPSDSERRGHNPPLCFLKGLSDDDARLPQLIRDETGEILPLTTAVR
jgi:hypothetical protein